MPPPDGEGGQSWGWAQKRSKNLDGSLLLQHGSDKAPRLQHRWTNSIVMSLRQPAGSSSELLNGVEVESRDALEVADVADYRVPRSAIPRLGPPLPKYANLALRFRSSTSSQPRGSHIFLHIHWMEIMTAELPPSQPGKVPMGHLFSPSNGQFL